MFLNPGWLWSSRYFRVAPPPVEANVISFVRFKMLEHPTMSPPPRMTVSTFFDAYFSISFVPYLNFSYSYAPRGPFQKIVFVFFICLRLFALSIVYLPKDG